MTEETSTWQVVANELNNDAAGEEVLATGLTRAQAFANAKSLQGMHNPAASVTDKGLNFFIRRDSK